MKGTEGGNFSGDPPDDFPMKDKYADAAGPMDEPGETSAQTPKREIPVGTYGDDHDPYTYTILPDGKVTVEGYGKPTEAKPSQAEAIKGQIRSGQLTLKPSGSNEMRASSDAAEGPGEDATMTAPTSMRALTDDAVGRAMKKVGQEPDIKAEGPEAS